MKRFLLIAKFLLAASVTTLSQGVAINNTAAAANASAMLDVSSPNKGMLIPRVSTASRKAIANPATGLFVFDSTEKTLYMYDGHHWLGFAALTEMQRPTSNFMYGPDVQDTTLAGYSVSVWDQFAAIGVPYKKIGNLFTGGVYIYKIAAGQWQYITTLTPTGNNDASSFGSTLCLKGNFLVVGAPNHKNAFAQVVGAAYIYNYNGTSWINTQTIFGTTPNNNFAQQVAVNQFGNQLAISETGATVSGIAGAGIINVYNKPSSSFVLQTTVHDPLPGVGENFGSSLAMSPAGNYMLVGAPAKTVSGHYGSGYIGLYFRSGASWTETHTLAPPPQNGLHLGGSVALTDNYAVFSYGKSVSMLDFTWFGYESVFTNDVYSVAIDPVSEMYYVFSGTNLYSGYSAAAVKLKTFGFDGSNAFPQLLSIYNKNYVIGNPISADVAMPYAGAFYFGTSQY